MHSSWLWWWWWCNLISLLMCLLLASTSTPTNCHFRSTFLHSVPKERSHHPHHSFSLKSWYLDGLTRSRLLWQDMGPFCFVNRFVTFLCCPCLIINSIQRRHVKNVYGNCSIFWLLMSIKYIHLSIPFSNTLSIGRFAHISIFC